MLACHHGAFDGGGSTGGPDHHLAAIGMATAPCSCFRRQCACREGRDRRVTGVRNPATSEGTSPPMLIGAAEPTGPPCEKGPREALGRHGPTAGVWVQRTDRGKPNVRRPVIQKGGRPYSSPAVTPRKPWDGANSASSSRAPWRCTSAERAPFPVHRALFPSNASSSEFPTRNGRPPARQVLTKSGGLVQESSPCLTPRCS